jgi:Ni/Fe-hydrogenase subunit HybB-like protein
VSEITYEPDADAEDVGVTEHIPATVTHKSLNADILRMLEPPGKIWWGVFMLDLCILAVGGLALRNEIVLGLGVGGWTRPIMWASYITNFVFWVGIAHCGTLVSAILFLFRSHFRRAVYRVAEAMTVFGVLTAGLFPLIHTGWCRIPASGVCGPTSARPSSGTCSP